MSHRQGIHVNSKLLIQDMIPNKKKIIRIKSIITTDRLR